MTTFINTALNFVYFNESLVDIKAKCVTSIHNGDDMIAIFKTFNDYQKILQSMKKRGIRLQFQKCAFNSVAEFLRVEYKSGTARQYLPRGIATLVHGRIESVEHSDIKAIIQANEVRICEVIKRGFIPK